MSDIKYEGEYVIRKTIFMLENVYENLSIIVEILQKDQVAYTCLTEDRNMSIPLK